MKRSTLSLLVGALVLCATSAQGVVSTAAASASSGISDTATKTTTTMSAATGGSTASATLPQNRRLLLGIPSCTLQYLPGCPDSGHTVFGNIVNGGGATVFLRGSPYRGTSGVGPYNLSTVASPNGDYEFSKIIAGRYDVVPADQAGFTFTPSSVQVSTEGADARAPTLTRAP